MEVKIRNNERVEELSESVRVIQNPDGFCYGTDAVMLAKFICAKKTDKLVDFCTGTAIIPLLLSFLTSCKDMTGLEIQPEVADMASRSVKLNSLEDIINIRCADLRKSREIFEAETVDVVTCNPPYMLANTGKQNLSDAKTISRHEVMCTLKDVVENAAYLLKTGGRFYMVHRPERLADIMHIMKEKRLEPKRMQFVHSALNKAPSLVLIEGQKGRSAGLRLIEPVIASGIK